LSRTTTKKVVNFLRKKVPRENPGYAYAVASLRVGVTGAATDGVTLLPKN